MTNRYELSIEIRRWTAWLLAAAALLLLAHVCIFVLDHQGLLGDDAWLFCAFFDLDEEESLGTWFSSAMLLVAAFSLLLQARPPSAYERRWERWWGFLAIGFFVLSVDEVIGIHEYVNTVVDETRWTTYGAVIVAAVGLAYLPFLASLPARTRTLFVIAGATYVGGALGVERATDWYAEQDLLNTLEYNLWTGLEEFLEMAGVILFLYALWSHMARNSGPALPVGVRFEP